MGLPIRIEVEQARRSRMASNTWDRDSSLLTAALLPDADDTPSESPHVQALNQSLGIRAIRYRVVVDRAEFLLDPLRRISSFEVRTNPERWRVAVIEPPIVDAEEIAARMMVDFGSEDVASFAASVDFRHDPQRHQLAITLGDWRASRWHRLALGFDIGLTNDCYLCEIRLATFGMSIP